jgi:hypothetical protein
MPQRMTLLVMQLHLIAGRQTVELLMNLLRSLSIQTAITAL